MYIDLKFHSQAYHKRVPSYSVAYYVAYSLEWIESLRLCSTLYALYTYPIPHNDHINSTDLLQSQEHSLAKVGWTCPPRSTPWRRSCRCDA